MQNLAAKTAAAALIAVGMTGGAAADVLAVASRITPVNGTSTTYTVVPLAENGATTLNFRTTRPNELVVITYNAECSGIDGPGWVSVQILVDNLRATSPAAGANFAFCHSGVEAGAVRQAYVTVNPAGVHSVRVRAGAFGGSTTWTLDDSSIVVAN
jgi:hypothetical protein